MFLVFNENEVFFVVKKHPKIGDKYGKMTLFYFHNLIHIYTMTFFDGQAFISIEHAILHTRYISLGNTVKPQHTIQKPTLFVTMLNQFEVTYLLCGLIPSKISVEANCDLSQIKKVTNSTGLR